MGKWTDMVLDGILSVPAGHVLGPYENAALSPEGAGILSVPPEGPCEFSSSSQPSEKTSTLGSTDKTDRIPPEDEMLFEYKEIDEGILSDRAPDKIPRFTDKIPGMVPEGGILSVLSDRAPDTIKPGNSLNTMTESETERVLSVLSVQCKGVKITMSIRESLERHQAKCPECRRSWFTRLCPEGRALADEWWEAKQAGDPAAAIDNDTLKSIWSGTLPVAEEYPREQGTPLEQARREAVGHENSCPTCRKNRLQPCPEGATLRSKFWRLRADHPTWVPPTVGRKA